MMHGQTKIKWRTFYLKTNIHLLAYVVQVFIFQTKFADKIETQISYSNHPPLFLKKLCCLWDTYKNIVQPDRPQMTVWRTRISCWIPKATDIDSECVILINFPRKQWLHERASLLHYTYIAVLFTVSLSGSVLCKFQAVDLNSMRFSRVSGCCKCSNKLQISNSIAFYWLAKRLSAFKEGFCYME